MSKACYRAAGPCLYRNLALKISSRQKLRGDTARVLQKGPFEGRLNHVRCLKIWGRMPPLDEDESTLEDDLDAEPADMEEYDAEFGGVFARDLPDGSAEEVEEAWSSLIVVIRKCKHLTDLIWVCRNQLPPCLLRMLDQCHPSCRLDMRSFRLRSLGDPVTDPYELNLIQSPHLHSISVKTIRMDSSGKFDHNKSALFPSVALAPNLQHLNIVTPRPAASPQLLRARNQPAESWKGFIPSLQVAGRGALVSLSYFGYRGMTLEDIQTWPKYTDLSKLRCLILGNVSDPLVFRFMTQNAKLTSLTRLHVGLQPTTNNYESLISELSSFLEHLEPVDEIVLEGPLTSSVFDETLKRHGPTLHRLAVHPYQHPYGPSPGLPTISPGNVRKIESDCPRLEYLKISIPYSSAVDACDLSSVCPNLPHLRELTLHIDRRGSGTSPDEVGRRIWNLIDKAKTGFRLNRLVLVYLDVCLLLLRPFNYQTYTNRLLRSLREATRTARMG